jgi:hypothetical protein
MHNGIGKPPLIPLRNKYKTIKIRSKNSLKIWYLRDTQYSWEQEHINFDFGYDL